MIARCEHPGIALWAFQLPLSATLEEEEMIPFSSALLIDLGDSLHSYCVFELFLAHCTVT